MQKTTQLRGARVLLTDDNAINRQVVRLFLQPQGAVITEATNGQEALDALSGGDFDLVLLDLHMPVMDGSEAIRLIRASDHAWRDIPVIALTADAMAGDRERLLAMGMSGYVSKPVDQGALLTAIGVALGGASAGCCRDVGNGGRCSRRPWRCPRGTRSPDRLIRLADTSG